MRILVGTSYIITSVEVQPYNHIDSSQLQAMDSGMETTYFHGYPAHGELMDGPYTPEHFAGNYLVYRLLI